MPWIGAWLFIVYEQDPIGIVDAITNAPTGETTAQKILIWICVIQFLLLIASNFAQWRRTEKIHQSHKEAIRAQEAATSRPSRTITVRTWKPGRKSWPG